MLEEVRSARPYDGAHRQRWFTDADFDLTVWYEESGALYGFQLAYDKRAAPVESVLTWRNHAGFDVSRVDGAQGAVTPILRSGGRTPSVSLLQKFRRHAKLLDPDLKKLLVMHLRAIVQKP